MQVLTIINRVRPWSFHVFCGATLLVGATLFTLLLAIDRTFGYIGEAYRDGNSVGDIYEFGANRMLPILWAISVVHLALIRKEPRKLYKFALPTLSVLLTIAYVWFGLWFCRVAVEGIIGLKSLLWWWF